MIRTALVLVILAMLVVMILCKLPLGQSGGAGGFERSEGDEDGRDA